MDGLPSDVVLVVAHLVADCRLPIVIARDDVTTDALAEASTQLYYESFGRIEDVRRRWERAARAAVMDARRALRHLLLFAQTCTRVRNLLRPRWQWIYTELAALAKATFGGNGSLPPAFPKKPMAPEDVPRWYECAAMLCIRPVYERRYERFFISSHTLRRTVGNTYRLLPGVHTAHFDPFEWTYVTPAVSVERASDAVRAALARSFFLAARWPLDKLQGRPSDSVGLTNTDTPGDILLHTAYILDSNWPHNLRNGSVQALVDAHAWEDVRRAQFEAEMAAMVSRKRVREAKTRDDDGVAVNKFRRFDLF